MRVPLAVFARGAVAVLCIVTVSPVMAPRVAAAAPWEALAGRDTTCAPCRDFFRYADGKWLDETPIPADRSRYGAFDALYEQNDRVLHEILEQALEDARTGDADADARRIGFFYGTCMDSARAEAEGALPLKPLLERIEAIASPGDLARGVAWLQGRGIGAQVRGASSAGVLFRFGAQPDDANSAVTIATVGQGGLALPDRDYYTRQDSASVALLDAYRSYVAKLFEAFGEVPQAAGAHAAVVVRIETALARASMARAAMRDPRAVYHMKPVAALDALAPHFDWVAFLGEAAVPGFDSVNVRQPEFLGAMDTLLTVVPLDGWKVYLRSRVLIEAAPLLSAPFADAAFAFEQRLSGATEQQPRWKRCVRLTDQWLGEALGRLYVQHKFSPAARARVVAMVENLEMALEQRIKTLDWMTVETQGEAMEKLHAFGLKIGYPEQWRDYSTVAIEPGPFVANLERAKSFETHREWNKIGGPVDPKEWGMTPPTVNAYYSRATNDINFPAGILQPPFFDPDADDAVNYGGIGAVIGHEMTHGFDDRGRQYDGHGNLRDWWTAEDASNYKARADKVVEQFDGYESVPGVQVNGRLTLGENISDLGGLAIAYAALEKSLEGKPRAKIDGLTPEQRFFLSWARVWRGKMRPEEARRRVTVDGHSPPQWRVNGPLSNLPEFARAWGCKEGDPMVRPAAQRTRIW